MGVAIKSSPPRNNRRDVSLYMRVWKEILKKENLKKENDEITNTE